MPMSHMLLLPLFLLSSLCAPALGALPACASGVTCPTGGIWSEWTTGADQKCGFSCGACAQIYQTRTCLSTRAGCACTGDHSRYTPCNTLGCAYPAQKTCCSPYVLMKFNGTLQCGPLPKIVDGMSCCPVGGLWTTWTGYAPDDVGWKRTRECVSSSMGCACTGNATEYTTNANNCPCSTPGGTVKCSDTWTTPYWHPEFAIDTADCYAKSWFYAYDYNSTANFCEANASSTDTWQYGIFGYEETDGTCAWLKPFPCVGLKNLTKLTYTCNPDTGYWILDYFNVNFIAFNQFQYTQGTYDAV